MQGPDEAASERARIRWDGETSRFVLARSGGPGVKRLRLEEDGDSRVASGNGAAPAREQALYFADEDTWIWDYEDASVPETTGPKTIPTENLPPVSPPPSYPRPPRPDVLESPRFSLPPGQYAAPTARRPEAAPVHAADSVGMKGTCFASV